MKLGIYGSGDSGREAKEVAERIGTWTEIIFIDDVVTTDTYKGIKKMLFDDFKKQYSPMEAEIIIALGEPEYRVKLFKKVKEAGYSFANLIDPSAYLSSEVTIGTGIILKAGVWVSVGATLKDNICVDFHTVIGHDVVIQPHCQICSNVVIAGHCKIGSATYIGLSVPIRDGIVVGDNVVLGMGSVVVRDIPDNVIAMGNPARAIKKKDDSKVFKEYYHG